MSFKEIPLMPDKKGTVLFYPYIPKNSISSLKKVLSGRWIGQGPLVNKFEEKLWNHSEKGGGKMIKIKGKIIEKGGVNISTVGGKFKEDTAKKIPGTENNLTYNATGISVVLHPLSPQIPSMHFNTRYLETEKSWFGG